MTVGVCAGSGVRGRAVRAGVAPEQPLQVREEVADRALIATKRALILR